VKPWEKQFWFSVAGSLLGAGVVAALALVARGFSERAHPGQFKLGSLLLCLLVELLVAITGVFLALTNRAARPLGARGGVAAQV
jgi:hypothetical protein